LRLDRRAIPLHEFDEKAAPFEHFQEKLALANAGWNPVFRPIMRQRKNAGAVSDRSCAGARAAAPSTKRL
jgi:hypothetical protein